MKPVATFFALLLPLASPAWAARPIAKDALVRAVEQRVLTPVELAEAVRSVGAGFNLTPADESALRKAGANDAVIEAVRSAQVGASARSAGRPLEPVEVLLKLFHGAPQAAANAVRVRGVAFDVTPAFEKQIIESGGDKKLLALMTLRRLPREVSAAAPAESPAEEASAAPVRAASAPPAANPVGGVTRAVRVDAATQAAKLVRQPEAEYPLLAQRSGMTGEVAVEILVGRDGRVRRQRVVRGDAIFHDAALEAVRGYVYRPTMLDDQPIEVVSEVTVAFGAAKSESGRRNRPE